MADDLRTVEQVQADLDELTESLEDIHTRAVDDDGNARSLTEDEQTAWDAGTERAEALRTELAHLERRRDLARMAAARGENDRGAASPQPPASPTTEPITRHVAPANSDDDLLNDWSRSVAGDPSAMTRIRDHARRAMDEILADEPGDRQRAERMLAGTGITSGTADSGQYASRLAAQSIALRSTRRYRGIFAEYVDSKQGGYSPNFSAEQRQLLDALRNLNVGTTTAGGFQVPTHLDPTLVLTDQSSMGNIRAISRQETLVGANTWNGVSSAGVNVEWLGESGVTTDGSPSMASISIPTERADVFVQATIEYEQDTPGVAAQLPRLIADARRRSEATVFVTGTGAGGNQPEGVEVSLDAVTTSEAETTGIGALAASDVEALLYDPAGNTLNSGTGLPLGFHDASTWLLHPQILSHIHGLETDTVLTDRGKLPRESGLGGNILGRPYILTSAMDSDPTTGGQNVLIVGDFSNYIIVDKMAPTLEFIENMVDPTTARPIGERGWVLYFRQGAGVGSTTTGTGGPANAFRLLKIRTA